MFYILTPVAPEKEEDTNLIQVTTVSYQWGDNTTEIKHRITQTRKAIHALNSIWWHKNITKNRKLYIYQTTRIIQSILVYGTEVICFRFKICDRKR